MSRLAQVTVTELAYREAYQAEYQKQYWHYLDRGEPKDIAHAWAHEEACIVAREAEDEARDLARYGYEVHYGIPLRTL
jgi:hypothetical protein